jgi:hypothetical protein
MEKGMESQEQLKPDEIRIGGQIFQKGCPKTCPGKKQLPHQGSLCHRCPIFNCASDAYELRLLEPDHYRPDWAIVWKRWFDTGMKGFPELKFKMAKKYRL